MESSQHIPEVDARGMSRVYARVTESPAPSTLRGAGEEAELLRSLIDGAADSSAMYALLALKTRGTASERELRALSRRERELERRLQTAYYLLTGDTHPVREAHPSAPYLLRALRDQYGRELERSRLPLPPLPDLAAHSLKNADTLRSVIARTLY